MSCAFFVFFLSEDAHVLRYYSRLFRVYQRSRFFVYKVRRRFTVLTADVDRNSESGRVMPCHNNGLRPTH